MMPKSAHPMDVLEAAVPILAAYDPQLHDESRNANFKKATRLIASCQALLPHGIVFGKGVNRFVPVLNSPMQETFLYMLSGSLPDRATARDFDIV